MISTNKSPDARATLVRVLRAVGLYNMLQHQLPDRFMHAIVFTIAHTAVWSLRVVFARAIVLKAIARPVSKLKVEARSELPAYKC